MTNEHGYLVTYKHPLLGAQCVAQRSSIKEVEKLLAEYPLITSSAKIYPLAGPAMKATATFTLEEVES